MPIIKSARKRVKLTAKATSRNVKTKRALREALKALNAALETGKTEQIAKAERTVMSAVDQAAKKAVIHKNKAARKKAQIAAQIKAGQPTKSPKSTPKKSTSTAKRRAVKKTAPKKT